MAYALVGSLGAEVTGGTGAAITPAYGQTPTANNLLIAWLQMSGGTTLPATPAGWSLATSSAQGSGSAIYYKVAAGGDAAPTFALVAGEVLYGMLGEFSGGATTSPLDQTDSGTGHGLTSPQTATAAGADAASGELVIVSGHCVITAATNTFTHTPNNGVVLTLVDNAGVSTANHYTMGYGTTTGHGSADSDQLATTGTVTNLNVCIASFKLAPAPVIVATAYAASVGKPGPRVPDNQFTQGGR